MSEVAKPGESMDVEIVAIDSLVPDPKNPRKGRVAEIAGSLMEFGQHRPLVVHRDTRRIIVGNHTWLAATDIGWDRIWVLWVDDDDRTAIRRSIADNATGDAAGWIDDILNELLAEADGATIPGVTDEMMRGADANLEEEVEAAEPDYPLIPKLNEGYDYVIVVAKSTLDVGWMQETFGLRKEADQASGASGTSRVVDAARLRREWMAEEFYDDLEAPGDPTEDETE